MFKNFDWVDLFYGLACASVWVSICAYALYVATN